MVKTESVGPGEDTGRNLCPEVLEVKLHELFTAEAQGPLCCLIISSKGAYTGHEKDNFLF